jgi:ubiquinone/menaquinone biosynthesis C-methylase UbiE
MLDVARRRAATRFTWIQADASWVPLCDNSFDVVFESTVLCFHQDPRSILGEMVRVCRPGGRVAIGELNPLSPWQLWRRAKARSGIGYFRHAHWHSRRQLLRLLEQAGCAPTFSGRAVFFIPISRPNLSSLRKGMETLGKRLWPCFGAYYAIAATKKA